MAIDKSVELTKKNCKIEKKGIIPQIKRIIKEWKTKKNGGQVEVPSASYGCL